MGLLQLNPPDPGHIGSQSDLDRNPGVRLEEEVITMDVDLGIDIGQDPNRHQLANGKRETTRADTSPAPTITSIA